MTLEVIHQISEMAQAIIYLFRQDDTLEERLASFSNANFLIQDFKAEAKQVHILYEGGQKLFLVGLGKSPKEADLIKTLRSFFFKQKKNLPDAVVLNLIAGGIDSQWVEAIINGCILGDYDLGMYKTEKSDKLTFFERTTKIQLLVTESEVESAIKAATIGEATAWTQIRVMDLMNAPSNKKNPLVLADWAVDSGQKYGYLVSVFDEKQCEETGLKALLAVSEGSKNPPRFIVLEYTHPEATQKIGLVGKGVTFDTGGVSLKQSTNMHYMKSDMGGAAAVLGTIELAAKLQLPVHLIGVIPTTENSIDGFAIKPGDVIGSYSGKSIEVIDTDAEGRLILADGLNYTKRNYEPEMIIDLATLTGSCVATLGYAAAGLFTNNELLAQSLYESGQQTGEKLWRLPLWDDYKDELKSDVADVKNFHGKPIAGAIVAAKFLEVFVDEHPNWAHLDIAGMAFGDSEFGTMKSATAYGVRLLTHWLRRQV
jgi:leucyl aminopeptidase